MGRSPERAIGESKDRVRYPRVRLISLLLLGAVLVLQEPVRRSTLVLLRFPFTLTKTSAIALLTLPQLPGLAEENARLRAELAQQQLALAQLHETLRHLQQGQALLRSAQTHEGIPASVIARSTVPSQQTVVIDKGSHDGLTMESVIVDASGVIGRVTELHDAASLVLLLTDSESRVAGLIERSRESGLLVGRGRGQCELIYLDVDADIAEGDRVLTAGLNGSFPKGLLLGMITRVIRDQLTGSTSAWVRPAAPLGRVEDVLCLQLSP